MCRRLIYPASFDPDRGGPASKQSLPGITQRHGPVSSKFTDVVLILMFLLIGTSSSGLSMVNCLTGGGDAQK